VRLDGRDAVRRDHRPVECRQGRRVDAARFLLSAGAGVNDTSPSGSSALSWPR
jgi:hypothetical protein